MALPCRPAIDNAAQRLKQLGRPLDLIQNDQLLFVIRQVAGRAGKPEAIIVVLQIEVYGRLLAADLESKSGFSHLARTQQNHGGRVPEQILEPGAEAPGE